MPALSSRRPPLEVPPYTPEIVSPTISRKYTPAASRTGDVAPFSEVSATTLTGARPYRLS
ncbi:hypothetical protein [Rhodococcus sp. 1168]|uniref:hypothetical protein n=1 Tax=Rhodococcus sp. 1168 TaxID=2018041 RepID=UPI0020CB072D|nr:hypothetical protein [Rhodococcus sp. 1168]